ncbi:Pga63 protein [Candida orthopsilosis Co 90-125]|uniref:Protein transport protein SEC31 n=1 Tax=Candida orthopsilosis (strain 90-125) TaxID=1136231 RepID=H8WY94_CANO9|nr:Pga63 protein [Candida orthopsilosis Co 90-125]CCG21209.1 Pga63 protein [Candida orthopsilosis Co 90-125]
MVKISEINRTSTFAWSSDSLPLLATGTVAGAVDIDFSSSATLEIWDIFSPTSKNEPLFSAPVENKFYALAWSKPFDGRSSGLLAGAFENGIVEFWDVATLIKTKDLAKSSVHKSNKHTGAVKSLQFNPIQPHVLVTGGSNGQIFVWDTKNFSEPFAPGQAMTPMDEISSVAWNNSVSHIFASTGNSGYTSIWDLKSKKEVLHLSYNGPGGRANFSHVAWHPTKSTQLVTASDNDSCPLILTWDLRNSNAPEKVIEGHKKGVLSLDWCKQDANLLISCGKDNATILWNPIEGKKLVEYPTTANWAFKSRFAPSAPDIFATASFDGKITVQTIQDTSPPVSSKVTASNNDNDFWNEISVTETQQPVFEVKQAPGWLKNPVSVSFGFGSKLVSVESVNGKSIVKIEKYSAGFKKEGTDFENLKNDKYESIIETRLNDDTVKGKNHADWEILETFSKKGKDEFFGNEDGKEENKIEENKKSGNDNDSHKDAGINVDGDADFFEHLGNGKVKSSDDDYVPSGNFSIFRSNASEADKKLINLILSNRIEDAVESSLDQKKLVEALVLALDASEQVKQSVKAAYFKKHKEDSLARIIYNVSSKNVTDLVAHANVRDWKEIAKGIKAIAPDSEEYNDKMSELGDRILNANDGNREDAITCYLAGGALDKLANLWLQELPEYESELLKSDATKVSSPSEARLHVLTNFVEKVATYKYLSKIGGAIAGPSVEPISKALLEFVNLVTGSGEFELAEKVLQLLPNELASVEKERILKATGKAVKTTSGTGVNKSSLRATSSEQKVPRQPSVAKSRTQYPSAPSAGLQQFQTPPAPTPQPTGFQYATPPMPQQAPTAFTQQGYPSSVPKSTNPYAKSNPYAPTNIYKAASPVSTPAALNPSGVTPPPPPAGTSSAPKSNKSETDGWNDLPETFKPKTTAPRRAAAAAAVATPAPVAVASPSVPPLPNHSSQTSFNNSFAPPKRTISTTGFAPPPKSSSRSASRTSIPTQQVPSPKPTPTTKYAPPPGTEQPSQAGIPNFGAPPTAATSPLTAKNPYAPTNEPAPAKVPFASPPPLAFGAQPTPPAMPPNNPYAPPPSVKNSSPQVPHAGAHEVGSRFGVAAPPQQPFGISSGTPAQPPFASVAPPPTGPTRPPVSVKEQPPAASVSQPAPAPAKHPQGDRSHISDDLKPIYSSLTNVIEAIKPNIPEKFAKHGADMERRLNILFDHLNNDDLSKPLTDSLKEVSSELENKKFAEAEAINVEIATNFTDELGNWHTGLKRLITMAGAMY